MKKFHSGDQPQLLSEDIISRARRLSASLFCDVMGRTGAMDHSIKPVASGMKVFGTAMTVDLRPGDNLFLHKAINIGQKGYVLVADGKGHTANAYLGELMAEAAQTLGLEGIVVDGAARDKETLCELNLPIFCKGFNPNGPHKDGPGRLNTSIACGGVSVQPGDLVVGDDDGVVIVPRNIVEEVLALAEKKGEEEEKRKQAIRRGEIEPIWLKAAMEPYGL
ncbi:RraA family protein [Paenibacillus sp. LMG 31456]|uniref:Putative 4-hydroxy-4-methyl-2-oxoglutarate aldolase n=1 Tax=Paenibacillus foliorum TaxID=2654974 RepID=A0A972K075_9BACL|nr:RraA family protein [Paenibacillus foliorum]NOU92588.1 RraA family protein [Paenibacillus foliorum]